MYVINSYLKALLQKKASRAYEEQLFCYTVHKAPNAQ